MEQKTISLHSDDQWIKWLDLLAEQDYVVIDDFISEKDFRSIRNYFDKLLEKKKFDEAGIGALHNHTINKAVRGDFIHWISKEKDPEMEMVFNSLDELVFLLKRYCFLSVSDYEFHLAHYPVGSFYKKHLDQFNARNNRLVSCILYLNDSWKEGDGGELKVFIDDEERLIAPLAKRLVLFKSDTIWHEVMPTNTGRDSITGWMLYQPKGLGFLTS